MTISQIAEEQNMAGDFIKKNARTKTNLQEINNEKNTINFNAACS